MFRQVGPVWSGQVVTIGQVWSSWSSLVRLGQVGQEAST